MAKLRIKTTELRWFKITLWTVMWNLWNNTIYFIYHLTEKVITFLKVFDSYYTFIMWKTVEKLTVQNVYYNVIYMRIFVKWGINVTGALCNSCIDHLLYLNSCLWVTQGKFSVQYRNLKILAYSLFLFSLICLCSKFHVFIKTVWLTEWMHTLNRCSV